MINKKYFKKIAIVATSAALLFQVQPAIAADMFDSGEAVETTAENQEQEVVEQSAESETAESTETAEPSGTAEVQPVEIAPIEIDPINIDIPAAGTEETSEDTQAEEIAPEQEEVTEDQGTAETETTEPEVTGSEELQPETPEYKTDFQFENDEVKITATATEEAKLPQNTEIKAVKLEEGTAAYEEAKAASADKLGTGEDADYCFYDVTFIADGQEITLAKGTVTIRMEFKNMQVDDQAQTQNIVHIEDTADGRQVEDVTSAAENGSNLQSVDFAM